MPPIHSWLGKMCGLKAGLYDSLNPSSSHPFQRLRLPIGVMDKSRRTISQQVPTPSAEHRQGSCGPWGVKVPGLTGPPGGLRRLKGNPRPDSEGSEDLGRVCLPAELAFP